VEAIHLYERALTILDEHESSAGWAGIQDNLGLAYFQLPTGDRGRNLERAIACFEQALQVRTERDFPVEWGRRRRTSALL
jgi:tetratricopeptide (TPR) repeat protein